MACPPGGVDRANGVNSYAQRETEPDVTFGDAKLKRGMRAAEVPTDQSGKQRNVPWKNGAMICFWRRTWLSTVQRPARW